MGYQARADGFLQVEPPLEWIDIKSSEFYVENQTSPNGRYPVILLGVEETDRETRTGFTRDLTCSVAVPDSSSVVDFRHLEDDIRKLIEELEQTGRKASGQIIVQPLHYGDGGIWRVVVEGDEVRKEDARLQWPDGSEVDLP